MIEGTLTDVCTAVVDCKNRTAPEDPYGTHFAVGTPAMRGNVINLNEARRINDETFAEWTARLSPQAGDLLFAREAPVGPVVEIPKGISIAPGQRTMLLRADPTKANSRFLRYYLISPVTQARLHALAHGSTVPHLRLPVVRDFYVSLPELPVQKAIADVLGALDDKIAANTKISQTSNHLANALFRQTLRDAEFCSDTFADLAQVSGGGTPSTKNPNFWDGEVPWATPTDITSLTGPYLEGTSRFISDAGLNACASGLYPQGSILMTSRATIGAFAMAQKPTAVNQGFIVVQPHDPELRYWLFHEMQSRVDEFVSLANGATFLELSRGNFKKFKVRQAPLDIMRKFNEQATALHDTARSALTENLTLAATRDALLPQLMSGKLRIKDAEALVGPVV